MSLQIAVAPPARMAPRDDLHELRDLVAPDAEPPPSCPAGLEVGADPSHGSGVGNDDLMRSGVRVVAGRLRSAGTLADPVRQPADNGPRVVDRTDRQLLRSARSIATTAVIVAVVGGLAAEFAHLFRTVVEAGASLLVGGAEAGAPSFRAPVVVVVLVMAMALLVAGAVGRRASRSSEDRLGLTSVAAAMRGEGDVPRLRPTLLRAGGNLAATAAQSSLGRETPILETGGSIGAGAGRLTGRSPAHLAAAGIAAGFAAAYHAPIAAVLYVEEHLRVRHDRRALLHTIAGALVGFAVLRLLVHGQAILPAARQPLGPGIAVLAVVGLLPALVASRWFLRWRERAAARSAAAGGGRARMRWVGLALASAVLVALVPLTAGNGMGAMRYASTHSTVQVAVALAVVKLLATTTAIGSGAPGGVFSPSLAVAGGAALLTFHAVEAVGVALPGSPWDGMLVAMTVGIAVSIRSPLVATVVVAEMTGDLRLVPICAVVVLTATLLDRALDRRRTATTGDSRPVDLHDEDA